MKSNNINNLESKTKELVSFYDLNINYDANPLLMNVDRFIIDLEKQLGKVTSAKKKEEELIEEKQFLDSVLPVVVMLGLSLFIIVLVLLFLALLLFLTKKGSLSYFFDKNPELKFGVGISFLCLSYLTYPKGKSLYKKIVKRDESLKNLFSMENELFSIYDKTLMFRKELAILLEYVEDFEIEKREELVEKVYRINTGYMLKTKSHEYFMRRYYDADGEEIVFAKEGDVILVEMLPEIVDGVLINSEHILNIYNVTKELLFNPYRDTPSLIHKINKLKTNLKH